MDAVRNARSNYQNACDVRVEVLEHGRVVTSHEYAAKDWVAANIAYGRLLMRGLHARMIATGLIESIISEQFNVVDTDGYHVTPCPACGHVCFGGHTHSTDATGCRIIADHWAGNHSQCNPDGCTEREEH